MTDLTHNENCPDTNHTIRYSMLVSVYKKVVPSHFDECLNSIFEQSYPADEVVVVCDGKLTEELDEVLFSYEKKFPEILKTVRLEENVGTGRAANIGISNCKNELVIKTDSDDISLKNRCDIQVTMFEQDSSLAMAGGYIREFDSETGKEISVKKVPLSHEDILSFAKRRNPINNPTIALRKSYAEKIGGFNENARCEDYDFVCRMLQSGAKAANTSEILLDYRVTGDNLKRRKNRKNTSSFISVRWKNFRRGFCSFSDFLVPCAAQLVMFILPQKLTGAIYKKLLRK